MEITKFLNELPIRIVGTHEEPFFYADEIFLIFGIKRKKQALASLSPSEILQPADRERLGLKTYRCLKNRAYQDDNLVLLTTHGLYRLAYMGTSQTAERFQSIIFKTLFGRDK